MHLQFAQNRANRTIKDHYFRSWVVATLHETQSGPPLRAQSDVSLPKSRTTRERGARECRASGPSRARALSRTNHTKRNSAYVERAAGRRQRCSRQYFKQLRSPMMRLRERSGQRSLAEPRSGSTFQQRDAQRRAKRGAEAPGQRTPLRRLLPRVGPPVHMPQLHGSLKRLLAAGLF